MTAKTLTPPFNHSLPLSIPSAVWRPIVDWLNQAPTRVPGNPAHIIAPTQLQALADQAGRQPRPGRPLRLTMPPDSWHKLAHQLALWTENPPPAASPPLQAVNSLRDLVAAHLATTAPTA